MLTAIINARCNSSRLKYKHFKKIGGKTIIEIIINNLKKNKLINEIYIASGSYKNNKIFVKKLKPKFKDLKFFFFDNEENVTKRIYKLTKKIKNKYSVLISGDCVLVDNFFIERLYKKLKENLEYDFVYCKKKVQHEGIKVFKTQAWDKVNKKSNLRIFQENPGYVIKKKPRFFKIIFLKPLKYESEKVSRLSVDTQSDLDFFDTISKFLKNKKKDFSFKNAAYYDCFKKFSFLNNHVNQKKPGKYINRKIFIISCCNNKYGLGHYMRSKVIEREINERYTSDVKTILINSEKMLNLGKENIYLNYDKIFKLIKSNSKELFIIDLPKELFLKIYNKVKNIKKLILIDQIVKDKKSIKIIPTTRLRNNKNFNIYSGKNYLLIKREINKINALRLVDKKNKRKILSFGGTFYRSNEIDQFLMKRSNITLILGNLLKPKQISYFDKFKLKKVLIGPDNFLEMASKSKEIYCKFGVSTYEFISLGHKPSVFIEGEEGDRLDEIKWLKKNNFINIYGHKSESNIINKLNINLCLNNISKIILKKIDE